MIQQADSNAHGYRAKAEPGSDRYKTEVAEPTMRAIDAMPREYKVCVHDFGYVDVYRAWKRGIPAAEIRRRAAAAGGVFAL